VSGRTRRRRALVLLAVALACGALATAEVSRRAAETEQQIGEPVPVVVAARAIAPGARLRDRDLEVVHVPARYAAPDAPRATVQAVGLRVAGPVASGSPITAGVVGAVGGGAGSGGLRRGERAIELAVAGGSALAESAGPGTRVDVLVSTDASSGSGRSFLALEDVELLGLVPGAEGAGLTGPPGASGPAAATATLRVTLRQAVYLTAAESFAGELRLLPRPPGDRRRIGRATVAADGL
jgi:pilus assembly protein CpaB